MKFLDDTVALLNETISNLFPCQRKNILGIAHLVRQETGKNGKPKIVPAVYKGAGLDVEYAGFDDRYSFSSYHRPQNMTARRLPGGYGDENGRVLLSTNMQLVVCADMNAFGKSAEEIALLIQFGFPDNLKPQQFASKDFYGVAFNVNSITLSAEQVFREEFQNVDYFLGPHHALLKCSYSIEATINKRCFKMICEPSKT